MNKLIFSFVVFLHYCASPNGDQQQEESLTNANDAGSNQANVTNKASNTGDGKDILDSEYSGNAVAQNKNLKDSNPLPPVNNSPPQNQPTSTNVANFHSNNAPQISENITSLKGTPNLANVASQEVKNPLPNNKPEVQAPPALPVVTGKPFSELKYIAYDFQREKKLLEITLHVDGENEYTLLSQNNLAHQKELVIRLPNSDCESILKRHLDSAEFASPVAYVRTRKPAKETYLDVILTMRDDLEPKISVKPHLVILTFAIPAHYFYPNAKVAVLSSKPEKAQILENSPTAEKPFVKNTAENTMDWLPPKTVELKGEEIPMQEENIPSVKTQAPLHRKAIPGPAIPAAPAMPQAPMIMPQSAPRLPGPPSMPNRGPGNLKFKDIDDDKFDEKDKPRSEDEKFEVRATGSVFSVAQELFDAATDSSLGSMDMTSSKGTEGNGADVQGNDVGKQAIPASQKKAIKIDFRAAPLSEVVRVLTAETRINFIIPPEIGRTSVNLTLRDVPWDVALKALLESNNLGMQEMGTNLVRIDTIKKFADDKKTVEDAKKSVERLLPTKVLVMRLSYGKASQVAGTVDKFLDSVKIQDPRTRVQFDDRTNSLIVEATPVQLSKVKILVERIDLQTPQVRITSRILEVTKTFKSSLGVAWGTPLNFDQGRGLGFGGLPFPNSMTSDYAFDSGVKGIANSTLNLGSVNNSIALQFKISAEESKGTTEVLQNQTIMVQDNEDANIDAGVEDIFVIQGSPTQQGSLQSVKYLLSLKVTPRITADGSVQMKLNIASDSPTNTQAAGATGKQSRSIVTTLLRKSGETAVIGGLYQTDKSTTNSGIPILMDIPLIGALFRGKIRKDLQRELMVLITPSIVNSSNTYLDSPANAKVSANLPATEEQKPADSIKQDATNIPNANSAPAANSTLTNSGNATPNGTLNSNIKNSSNGEAL